MVVATKKFAQLTTPLLGNIFSHRFAHLFSAPVHDKFAPGYKSLIYTPQDLKSLSPLALLLLPVLLLTWGLGIKAAVKAGAASLLSLPTSSSAAATPTTDTAPVYTLPTTSTSTSITTPATTANTPPKGIVNSQQLEKELFRMFANAVMYNKSSSEIVRETVIMANDVQGMVDNFRAAEEAGAKKALAARSSKPQVREESLGAASSVVASSSVVGDEEDKGRGALKGGAGGGSKKKKALGAASG